MTASLAVLLITLPCAAQVTDLDIWIDPNFDGLPGPSRGAFFWYGLGDSVAVFIDAHDFAWTNFLFYVSFGDSAAPNYISTNTDDVELRLDVSGGSQFPEDNFSFPNVVGFGGISFDGQSGARKLGTLFFKGMELSPLNAASIRPIANASENSAAVFSQLGNGASYGTFEDGTVVGLRATICTNDLCPTDVTIGPSEPQIAVGDSLPLTALLHWWEGGAVNFTTELEWSSSDTSVAIVDSFGVARGVSVGTSFIRGTAWPLRDSTSISVLPPPPTVEWLEISPVTARVPRGMTVAFSASGTYSDGSKRDLTEQVVWTSGDPLVANIDTAAVVTGVQIGKTIVEARLDELSTSSTVMVVEELRVTRPMIGDSWFVGALEQIEWTSPGPVDLEWSIDDGSTFATVREDVASEEHLLRVPQPASASARVRLRLLLDGLTFLSSSDSFAVVDEIEASSFEATETADSRVRLSWTTSPAPPVIVGYRIERAMDGATFAPLHPSVIDSSSFVDEAPIAGATYRLIAVNGWNDEAILATTALETILLGGREIAIIPNPSPRGETAIVFRNPSAADPGASQSASIIVIHDMTGRRVRLLSAGRSGSSAVQTIVWDGRDENGDAVAPGHYAVELRSDGNRIATSRVTIVR